MPIYEYECRKCGAHTEAMQKVSDKPLTKCKKCGGRLDKKWSLSGFQFKGDGWYVTDYSAKKSEAKEETTAETKTSETTTESTPKVDVKADKKEAKKSKSKKPSASVS
jgi:putative FmdB family regulatory protein